MMRILAVILSLHLCACASHRAELKSPCDPLRCINRINVNTWYKG